MTFRWFLKCFWELSCLYLSPPPLSEHLVCSGSTQRGHVLSSQCLLKTSLESSWHRQDTAALSTRTRLSLCLPGHSFTALFYPTCSASFSRSRHPPPPPHKPSSCLVLSSLSIRVTSLLLFVLSVLSFLSHFLDALCSQRVAVADTAVAVSRFSLCSSDEFEFVMRSVCVWFWASWQVTVSGCRCCLGSCCVAG